MVTRIEGQLEIEAGSGRLRCVVTNTSGRTLRLREVAPVCDLSICTEGGVDAVPAFTSSFGKLVVRRTLAAGESMVSALDLREVFLFPAEGRYRVGLAYDSKRKTFKFDDGEDVDAVVAFSNSVELAVSPEQVTVPVAVDPEVARSARAYLERVRNRRWWQFWIH